VITTVAGSGVQCATTTAACGDNGAATSAQLNNPRAVAVDASGNLYIADTSDNRIRMVTAATGVITTVAGGGANPTTCTGSTNSVGDGCAATSAKLSSPYGVTVDASGNLYIADTSDQRIRLVTASSSVITTFAGTGAACTTSASTGCVDGGLATSGKLDAPRGVALDASGNLYIADYSGNRLREVTGGNISTVAGTGVACTTSATTGCTDGGAATSGKLSGPSGVAVDATGNLYIADATDNRIRKVTGTTISTFAGNGSSGFRGDAGAPTSAEVANPNGVVVDSSGYIYIVDTGNARIRVVNP
jgi:sugar lactone lactonase YvrE